MSLIEAGLQLLFLVFVSKLERSNDVIEAAEEVCEAFVVSLYECCDLDFGLSFLVVLVVDFGKIFDNLLVRSVLVII